MKRPALKYLLATLGVLLFLPNLFPVHLVGLPDKPVKNEAFDPHLARKVQSMDQLESFIDSIAQSEAVDTSSAAYADIISSVMRFRFYHSYSHYSLAENWLAAAAGKLVWYDLSAIVIADDIMKYPMAACSQQSIVLMDFFKRKNIPFRKVGFDHHFAVEAKIGGKWLFFDPNLEPDFKGDHQSLAYYLENDRLKSLYENILPTEEIPDLLANPFYGPINEYPAKNARIFHRVTSFVSHWFWMVPFLIIFGIRRRELAKNKPLA